MTSIPEGSPAPVVPPVESRPPVVRPAFLVALGVLVLVCLLAGAFLLGRRSGSTSLSAGDARALTEIHTVGGVGLGSSIMTVVRSDDERVRLALLVQRSLASDLSTISEVVLLQAGEDVPEADRRGVFDRSGWDDISQSERDEAFLVECAEWAQQVIEVVAANRDATGRMRPLVEEMGAQADELLGLCRPG